MAARFKPKQYSLTGSPVTLHVALGASENDEYNVSVIIRASNTNAGTVLWKNAAGDVGGFLEAGEAASFDLAGAYVSAKQIYLDGTAADIVYLTVLG